MKMIVKSCLCLLLCFLLAGCNSERSEPQKALEKWKTKGGDLSKFLEELEYYKVETKKDAWNFMAMVVIIAA